jgi:Ca-activated chloride channel family protein
MPQPSKISFIALVFYGFAVQAQKDAKTIYEGNNQYYGGRIPESSSTYAKALELNPSNRKANFNLGNALYKNAMLIKSGEMAVPPNANMTPDSLSNLILDQAAQNFAVVANSVSNKDTLHRAWHNIGNCYLQKKDYKQAVEAYKKALRFDPKDEDSRYNLAYALKHLPKEKKGGGGSSQQQQNKKEEDKNDKNKNSSPKKDDMDKQQAEQILKALMNAEKKLQDKRKQKQNAQNSTPDKDW